MSETFADLLAEEEETVRYFEAWLWANGRWSDVLRYLARRLPGEEPPEEWWHKKEEGGRTFIVCDICGSMLPREAFYRSGFVQPIRVVLSDHAHLHLEKVRKSLKLKEC